MVVHMHNNKGLANVVALIMVLIVVLTLVVPFLLFYASNQSSKEVSTAIVNNYQYLKNLQVKQITSGHPAIFYNSSIVLEYTNGTFTPPSNLTITNILYLNQQGIWVSISSLKYPIVVSTGESLKLPSYTNGRPIIIVTSLGNIFFLTPGSSIGPFATGAKGGLEILTQISNASLTLGVTANISTNIYGQWKNFTTPVAFPNNTGTFQVKVPTYVYYQNSKGEIITGVFRNWYVIGSASLNSTNTQGVKATLLGQTAVLIANYTPLLAKAILEIQTNYPGSITVNIDGKTYTVNNGSTITVPAGFVNVTVLSLQANYTASSSVIQHYKYSSMQYSSNTINTYSTLIFILPSTTQTLNINYVNDYNYYLVTIKGYNYVNCLQIGNNLYQYDNSYWIIGGNYTFAPIGVFTGTTTYGAVKVVFTYSNGPPYTYKFPNIPSYVIINQPMTIKVYYGTEMYWQPLQ